MATATRFVLITVTMWLFGLYAAAAQSTAPASVAAQAQFTLQGRLDVRWGDGAPGSELAVQYEYALVDDAGNVTLIDLSDAQLARAGGLLAINGRDVEVALSVTAQTTRPVATSLHVFDAQEARRETNSRMITGSKPWITVACKFSDVNDEPRSLNYFQGMYDNAPGRLDDYWREVSYNNIDIVGSTAIDWATLPGTQADYVPSPGSGTQADLDQLFDDCLEEVDDFVDFSLGGTGGFEGINLMFNDQLDCCAWGGSRFASLDGVSKSWRTTWNPPFSYNNVAVIAHEMGHGFGLPHTNNSDNDSNPYDNPWDVMSAATRNSVGDGTYGARGKHINSYHKDRLGWIASNELFVASDDDDALIEIEPLGAATAGSFRMARIPINGSSSNYYTVEVREAVGNYEGELAGNGNGDRVVIIHRVQTNRREPAWVIDADTPPANFSDTEGVIWRAGEIFDDLDNEISVTVQGLTAAGYQLRIVTGDGGVADSDGDGVADDLDNCTLISNDDQRDTNGDGYGNACDADLNNDDVVNATDLGLLRTVFFTADEDADFNGDGVVNAADLGMMRIGFFAPPGPSGVAARSPR